MPLFMLFYLTPRNRTSLAAVPIRRRRAESAGSHGRSGRLPAAAPQHFSTAGESGGTSSGRTPGSARPRPGCAGAAPGKSSGTLPRPPARPHRQRAGRNGSTASGHAPGAPPQGRAHRTAPPARSPLPARPRSAPARRSAPRCAACPGGARSPLRDAASLPETLPSRCAYPGNDSGRRRPSSSPSAPAAAQSRGPQGAGWGGCAAAPCCEPVAGPGRQGRPAASAPAPDTPGPGPLPCGTGSCWSTARLQPPGQVPLCERAVFMLGGRCTPGGGQKNTPRNTTTTPHFFSWWREKEE